MSILTDAAGVSLMPMIWWWSSFCFYFLHGFATPVSPRPVTHIFTQFRSLSFFVHVWWGWRAVEIRSVFVPFWGPDYSCLWRVEWWIVLGSWWNCRVLLCHSRGYSWQKILMILCSCFCNTAAWLNLDEKACCWNIDCCRFHVGSIKRCVSLSQ